MIRLEPNGQGGARATATPGGPAVESDNARIDTIGPWRSVNFFGLMPLGQFDTASSSKHFIAGRAGEIIAIGVRSNASWSLRGINCQVTLDDVLIGPIVFVGVPAAPGGTTQQNINSTLTPIQFSAGQRIGMNSVPFGPGPPPNATSVWLLVRWAAS
jgi:hypothetical protein